jgi:UDP-N-acetylenolpyruvoylglucosamine reductase
MSAQIPSIVSDLTARVSPETVIRCNEPLAPHTTLRVGGPADIYVEPVDEKDMAEILRFCGKRKLPFFVLGRGSNLLVRDRGYRGLVISLSSPEFASIEVVGSNLRAGAGARQKALAVEARRAGLSGVEFLDGIPGTIGGALRMNAGAMGSETFDVVESVRVMDYHGNVREYSKAEMQVSYRCCALLKNHIALSAVFRCTPQLPAEIASRMEAFNEKRWSSQPAAPSAGCMFRNPEKIPAGKLIEELGLKGAYVGGAMVSVKHGNFIVNGGSASAKDVLELVAQIRSRAKQELGIDLHTEVEIVGED